ncbi:glycosyltransferase family 2 protein [Rhodovulum kholense]|uniref:Glycosyl transferase family 2 n=1 Tax=Rhodovulum kholense TaxID=453584 RepID=A0A8E2VM32_9RHOB|nr:glycosyltransferase family 2 protein [Rhodovulum kholense]PTW51480.1 glycosyl transferase family 2 [Rhodovulum kholense]
MRARVLIVTTARNEGPYLPDWLAHHLGAGADGIIVVTNDCEDGTDRMLDLLDAAGLVTHLQNPALPGKSLQWQALKTAARHPRAAGADWILGIDLDEYLNIHVPGHDLAALVAALPPGTDAVALPWRLFGDNGLTGLPDRPVTELFTAAMPADTAFPVAASFFKTLYRPEAFGRIGIHRPRPAPGRAPPRWVDGSGTPLPERFAASPGRLSLWGFPAGRALAEINHYAVKTPEAFLIKRARGLPNRTARAVDLGYWVERNFNTVDDRSIAAMAPATAAMRARLAALPGLADLHAAAMAWHRAEAARQIATPEGHAFYSQLVLAGGSRALPPDRAAVLYGLYPRGTASAARP